MKPLDTESCGRYPAFSLFDRDYHSGLLSVTSFLTASRSLKRRSPKDGNTWRVEHTRIETGSVLCSFPKRGRVRRCHLILHRHARCSLIVSCDGRKSSSGSVRNGGIPCP